MSLPPQLFQLRVAKRVRENKVQSVDYEDYYDEYRRLHSLLSTLSYQTSYNTLTITSEFAGDVYCQQLNSQGNAYTPTLQDIFTRIGPVVAGLAMVDYELFIEYDINASDRIYFLHNPIVPAIEFTGTYAGVQTEPWHRFDVFANLDSILTTYTPTNYAAWLTEEPAFLYRLALNSKNEPSNISQGGTTTPTAYTEPYTQAPSDTTNADLTNYPSTLIPYRFQFTQHFEMLLRSPNLTYLLPPQPYLQRSNNYDRFFYMNSLVHFTLPPAQNLVKTVYAFHDSTGSGTYDSTILRPCLIHHPTAIFHIQAVFTFKGLGDSSNFVNTFRVSTRVECNEGPLAPTAAGHPTENLPLIGHPNMQTVYGAPEHVRRCTVAAPDFYFPLSQIPETSGAYGYIIVEGHGRFRTASSERPYYPDIDCTIYVNSITF